MNTVHVVPARMNTVHVVPAQMNTVHVVPARIMQLLEWHEQSQYDTV